MEKKLSGLDWSGGKEGRLVKNPAQIHFFKKTHETQFKNEIHTFPGGKKKPAGIPLQSELGLMISYGTKSIDIS